MLPVSRTPHPVVVLTGASSGIGRATALAFAREGARLVLAARGREGLESVAAQCLADSAAALGGAGRQPLVVPTDVSDPAAVQALARAAIDRHGHIDMWINNVGVGAVGVFDQTPLEAHRRVIESNLLGHLNGAHAVLQHFRQRRRGTLVNMISIGGYSPTPYASAYAASKFGLRGWSEALRAELADLPEVHVCEVYPTFVDTPGFAHGANYTGKRLNPPRPMVDARQVAARVVSLWQRPRPAVMVGAAAVPARLAHAIAPQATVRATFWLMQRGIARAAPAAVTDGNLFKPSVGHGVDGSPRTALSRAARKAGSAALLAGLAYLGWRMLQATAAGHRLPPRERE